MLVCGIYATEAIDGGTVRCLSKQLPFNSVKTISLEKEKLDMELRGLL